MAKHKTAQPHHADDLSFMARRIPKGTGIHYWLPKPSGNQSEDWETGKRLGDQYLDYIGKHPTVGHEFLLSNIVHDMLEQAKAGQPWNAVIGGFLRRVNIYAMSAARLLNEGKVRRLTADEVAAIEQESRHAA